MNYRPLLQPHVQFFDGEGNPLANGKVYTYVAGTTTLLASYKDNAGTLNTNPIILDGGGFCDIWLSDAKYKLVVEDANAVMQWTVDSIDGVSQTIAPANLDLTAPDGVAGYDVNITAGDGSGGAGGDVVITAGDGSPAGNVVISPGSGGLLQLHGSVGFLDAESRGVAAPYVSQVTHLASKNADIGTTVLKTPLLNGLYRVSGYIVVDTPAGTSSTLPKIVISWGDRITGAVQTIDLTATNTGNSVSTYATGSVVINAKGSVAINYSTAGYLSNPATAMVYDARLVVEQISLL